MSSSNIERKLAAIMFTDIAGYTESMSKSESKSLDTLEKKRSIIKPLLKEYKGTFVKEIGDGSLSYFESAVNAATCAVKLQQQTYDDSDMNIRAGIHIGDIVFKDGDVFGDGVNVASRLESIAPKGGVCVSKNVYDELLNQDDFDGVDLGLQSLKGVGRLVEVYALKDTHLTVPNPDDYTDTKIDVHSDDEVPSIAIIPFDNKGADEDVFYAYGISADLISDVSSAGVIRVPSLKRVEELTDLKLDEKAKELDVRYTAEGTLWKMGEMFQLSVDLYDTKDKKVVWSDRWQEKWDNLPNIKTCLSDGLLKALDTKPKLEKRLDTTNPEAYKFYLKAKHKFAKRQNTDDIEIARELLNKAIELENNLILAKILLGETYREMGDYDMALEIYMSSKKHANSLGDINGILASFIAIGNIHFLRGDYDTAFNCYESSLKICKKLDDNKGIEQIFLSIANIFQNKGEYNKALKYYNKSLDFLQKFDDKLGIGYCLFSIGNTYFKKQDKKIALQYHNKSLKIFREINDKIGILTTLTSLGIHEKDNQNYKKALKYYKESLVISQNLGNKHYIKLNLIVIGQLYSLKFDFDKSLKYFKSAFQIIKELKERQEFALISFFRGQVYYNKGDIQNALNEHNNSLIILDQLNGNKELMGANLFYIGKIYFENKNYKKAEEFLEKSLSIQKEMGLSADLISLTPYLYLTYKQLGKDYDINEIQSLIKEAQNIEFELNLRLYELLEESSYLEAAYNQVQEKASAMVQEQANKFLSYPIPKAIIEEWEKVSKVKN